MSVAVRRAEVSDSAELAALRWTWRVDEEGEQPAGTVEEYRESMRQWWMTHPHHVAVLADEPDTGTAVGMAWLAMGDRVPSPAGVRRRSAWLQSVYVRPAHRDRGIGRNLLTRPLSSRDRAFAYRMHRRAGHGTGVSAHQVGKAGCRWPVGAS